MLSQCCFGWSVDRLDQKQWTICSRCRFTCFQVCNHGDNWPQVTAVVKITCVLQPGWIGRMIFNLCWFQCCPLIFGQLFAARRSHFCQYGSKSIIVKTHGGLHCEDSWHVWRDRCSRLVLWSCIVQWSSASWVETAFNIPWS